LGNDGWGLKPGKEFKDTAYKHGVGGREFMKGWRADVRYKFHAYEKAEMRRSNADV